MDAIPPTRVLRLYPLTMVPEGDEVMVGRPDVGSYALFPADGAELLRRLGVGDSVADASDWCRRTYGSLIDMEDFLETLYELDFVDSIVHNSGLEHDQTVDAADPVGVRGTSVVRWQRLGRALFSPPAWTIYVVVVAAAVAWMIKDPSLRPAYHQLFFSHYIALIPVVIMVSSMPLIILHETYHALAGRRLGLPSTFRISRRWVYLVAETRMDALFSVPRRQRYLPFLAGMVIDVVATGVLTLLAGLLRSHGAPSWLSGLLLAVALYCVLRLLWQFMFYLETDLYFVVSTLLGCPDLQSVTRQLIADRIRRFRGRPTLNAPAGDSRERRIAQAYAPMLIGGYAVSLAIFCWIGLPATLRFWSIAAHRIATHTSVLDTIDAVAVFLIDGVSLFLFGYVTLRDRRERRRSRTHRSLTQGVPS